VTEKVYENYIQFNVHYCLLFIVVELGLGLELGSDLVSGWLVVMRTYLYYFPLSLSLSLKYLCGHAT